MAWALAERPRSAYNRLKVASEWPQFLGFISTKYKNFQRFLTIWRYINCARGARKQQNQEYLGLTYEIAISLCSSIQQSDERHFSCIYLCVK